MPRKTFPGLLVLALLVFTIPLLATAADLDISGIWRSNSGGMYYIRQIGNEVWWFGEQAANNPSWSHVAHGRIDGNTIELSWADVPKGRASNQGQLYLRVVSDNEIRAYKKTGGFTDSVWSRTEEILKTRIRPLLPLKR